MYFKSFISFCTIAISKKKILSKKKHVLRMYSACVENTIALSQSCGLYLYMQTQKYVKN